MRLSKTPVLALVALLVLCFGLAARLETWFQSWPGSRTNSSDVLGVLLGDSRRMFANHFFVKADAYFHSGFYPTVFDNREAFQTPHMAEDSGTVGGHNQGDEFGFMGRPRDWIDAFSRNLFPAMHTHLDEGGAAGHATGSVELGHSADVREILPWLRLSAELDPNSIRTYTVTAYWLRQRMGKPAEAEQFLREGLRANPGSYEILYELGRVFSENHHDPAHARNLWELALRNYDKLATSGAETDKYLFLQIIAHLAVLEDQQGNYQTALAHMEVWQKHSPNPDEVQKRMEEVTEKLASASSALPVPLP
jgi:tetratricopeptide (TPR) repeat protein